ncbi:uncharacterized protein LOC132948688 [Metopolophium dirhodum]|uniref:uncharacterized protein LOC132948688 n=1 Tax=Metopolophium dirhodum TaxID=44670 RepID=UPI0029902DF6|nr:uncharacterized protein LOC132948688 [Metopolophium dirhodum]
MSVNLQKKWRNIRDCFVKAHKAKENKSGSEAKKKCPYVFYDNLLFLKDTVSVNLISSNITSNIETHNEDEIVEGQRTAAHPSDSSWVPKRNKKNKNDDIGRELIGILNKNLETKNVGEDEDRLFFMSLVKDFKKIPEHLRMQTKLDVLKVIQDAQRQNYPNTWDWNTQNNAHRGPYSAQMRHHPYNHTPIHISIPATTPHHETAINNTLSPLSNADSTNTYQSHESETSYIDLFNSIP